MFRRRGKDASAPAGRANGRAADKTPTADTSDEHDTAASQLDGPFDAADVDLDAARRDRIDLGGLLVKGTTGMKLQLQVDKGTGNATSVVMSTAEAAVQLMAVAAPRGSGLWEQTRLQIAADARRRGGRADEAQGPFGVEVRVVVPVQGPDGKQVLQPSRVSAVDGPRWMLRATFLGKATTDATAFQELVDVVRQSVVVRGANPMPPGDVIALKPPAGGPDEDTQPGPSAPLQA